MECTSFQQSQEQSLNGSHTASLQGQHSDEQQLQSQAQRNLKNKQIMLQTHNVDIQTGLKQQYEETSKTITVKIDRIQQRKVTNNTQLKQIRQKYIINAQKPGDNIQYKKRYKNQPQKQPKIYLKPINLSSQTYGDIDQKLFGTQQKVKKKSRIKRFNLQQQQLTALEQTMQKSLKASQIQNVSTLTQACKIKPKLGTGQLPLSQHSLLITTWNVNGIRFSVSKNHLPYLINQTKADILCLTQTKMDQISYMKQPIKLFGFSGYWGFCKCSSGYSGVVVFSRYEPMRVIEGLREIVVSNRDTERSNDKSKGKTQQKENCVNNQGEKQVKEGFDDNEGNQLIFGEDFDKQGRVMTLQFKNFYLVTVYVPAAGKYLQRLQYKCKQFEPRLFLFCQKLMQKKPVIIAGDLNTALTQLDTHMSKNTTKGPAFTSMQRQSLQSFINRNNLIDAYRYKNPTKKQFTWYHIKYFGRQYAIGKRLDYFLLTKQLQNAIISSQIKQKYKGSDHSPVELRLDIKKLTNAYRKQK